MCVFWKCLFWKRSRGWCVKGGRRIASQDGVRGEGGVLIVFDHRNSTPIGNSNTRNDEVCKVCAKNVGRLSASCVALESVGYACVSV